MHFKKKMKYPTALTVKHLLQSTVYQLLNIWNDSKWIYKTYTENALPA